MQLASERIVIGELAVIRLCVRISRGADILEISLDQRRFVFRQGRRPCRPRRSGSASAQKKRADRDTAKRKIFPVMQWKQLLTVIHNHMQEYFFAKRRLGTTKCEVGII
jgi:hypothetical protein